MASCILSFFTTWHALGKWLCLEVSDLINEFILGLIYNMIALVREVKKWKIVPHWKKHAMGRMPLGLHLLALAPSRSILLASYLPWHPPQAPSLYCSVQPRNTEPCDQGLKLLKLCTERNSPAVVCGWEEMSRWWRLWEHWAEESLCVFRHTIKKERTGARCPEHKHDWQTAWIPGSTAT